MALDSFASYNIAPPAEINFDVMTAARQIYLVNMTKNVTVNFRGNPTTTLSSMLTNQMVEVSFLYRNSSSGRFYVNNIKVDGGFHYPEWLNATAIKTGTANRLAELRIRFYKVGNTVFSIAEQRLFAK